MRMHVLGVLLAGLSVAVATAPAGAADLAAAKKSFGIFCAKCHGADGKGNGASAATLSTKPRDLTDCKRMKDVKEETLFRAIKEGGESVNLSKDMPAWKDGMEDDEIHALVSYVRSLCKQ
ncbi:MAG: c-type cytochrome [Deltaproteobacteria bacterium]|nr:c-type cytochrome [Deltaproteobacteria bacterium]